MRRLLQPVWFLLALIFLVEAWLWVHLQPVVARVLASATIITGMIVLGWGAGLLMLAGIAFTAIGLFAPHAVHLM